MDSMGIGVDLVAAAGMTWIAKDVLGRFFLKRLDRADDASKQEIATILQTVDRNQKDLCERIREDRENATKQFEDLFARCRRNEDRLARICALHPLNHPGQEIE